MNRILLYILLPFNTPYICKCNYSHRDIHTHRKTYNHAYVNKYTDTYLPSYIGLRPRRIMYKSTRVGSEVNIESSRIRLRTYISFISLTTIPMRLFVCVHRRQSWESW